MAKQTTNSSSPTNSGGTNNSENGGFDATWFKNDEANNGKGTTCPRLPSQPPAPQSYNYNLKQAVTPQQLKLINESKIMSFHCIGDSGGGPSDKDNGNTAAVAALMESQRIPGEVGSPCFCYHVGDVVYPNGAEAFYQNEFYDPYSSYGNAILAIPGNHDSWDASQDGSPLFGYRTNFLNLTMLRNPNGGWRPKMNLPYYYWILDTPVATIIGLCAISNCISQDQQAWFNNAMMNAPKDKCLFLAVHYPPYSYDMYVGAAGYTAIIGAINEAFLFSDRKPDLVLSGHSHSYQRIYVEQDAPCPSYPCVISGAAGNSLTPVTTMQRGGPGSFPILECANANNYGALKITVDANKRTITGEYYIVSNNLVHKESSRPFDKFTIDY